MNESIRQIAVFSLQGIGNAILSLPIASGLKSKWPNARVSMIVNSDRVAEIFRNHVAVDRVYSARKGKFSLLRRLRGQHFDLAVFAFPSAFRSHLLGFLAGIPHRVGHRIPDRKSFVLNRTVPMIERAHDLDQNLSLLRALDIHLDIETIWPPLACVPKSLVEKAGRYLLSQGLNPEAKYLGLHTGSDPHFVEKRWPPEKFARVAEAVYERYGVSAIVFDGPSETGTGIRVARAAKTSVHPLMGWGDLADAWGLMTFCRWFVSNDSGLMNLAEASGVPTIALFGPSEPHRTRPYRGMYVKSAWKCSPCFSLNAYPGCPFPETWCMNDLDPEKVVRVIDRMAQP